MSYGVYHSCGMSFSDNAEDVHLSDFQFHINERFTYEYDFFAHWEHEIRLEPKLPIDIKKKYPLCVSGHMAPPDDECRDIGDFMEQEEYYKPHSITFEVIEAFEKYKNKECEKEDIEYLLDRFKDWQDRAKFNRRIINDQLQEYMNDNYTRLAS